jgi:two-component system, OmpR family, response regulator
VSNNKILIVEDDRAVFRLLQSYLEREGYSVINAETVASMRRIVESSQVSMVLLDVGLPDEDGWSALKWLRARSDLPIIMLTGKGEMTDKVVGLELGADDYLAKPFELRELLARIRTIQRRTEKAAAASAAAAPASDAGNGGKISFAGWVLDPASHLVKSDAGETLHLTQAEFRILSLLAKNPNVVVPRDDLMSAAAGRDWDPFDRSVDVHISNLRKKLDLDPNLPSLIRTVRGAGYMFVPKRD